MAWRIVQQPNGLFARFSEIVDDFTDWQMSQDEAIALCTQVHGLSREDAVLKVTRGIDAGQQRFDEAVDIITVMHGQDHALQKAQQMSTLPHQEEEK